MPRSARYHRPRPRSNWDREGRGSASERGYDSRWHKLREAYISSNPLCDLCKRAGRTKIAEEVHHKEPFGSIDDPLRLDWDNLQSLCSACHV